MDKPKVINGFTVLEMLLVILIISVFTFQFSTFLIRPSLTIFMEKMMNLTVITQEQAYIEKEKKEVSIYQDYALFQDSVYEYPSGISCTPISFHYNAKGNINKGGSIYCHQGNLQKRLIFQIGTGRVRLE